MLFLFLLPPRWLCFQLRGQRGTALVPTTVNRAVPHADGASQAPSGWNPGLGDSPLQGQLPLLVLEVLVGFNSTRKHPTTSQTQAS